MTDDDLEAVLDLYDAYRGGRSLPQERDEFIHRFRSESRDRMQRAIRESANVVGYVTLASVAKRHADILDGESYGPNVTPPHVATLEREREAKLQQERLDAMPALPESDAPRPNLGPYATRPGQKTPLELHNERHAEWLRKGVRGL